MPHLDSGDPLVLPSSNFTPEIRTNLTVGVAKPGTPDGRQAYFQHRLAAIGVAPDQAKAYGLSADSNGSILQLVRTFDGAVIEYIPHERLKQWEMLQRRKTAYNLHEDGFYCPLSVTRRHPDILAEDPSLHKYNNPYKQNLRPLPTPLAIQSYREKITGGLIVFTEGYFKAAALDVAGIEAVAFLGITVYRLNPDLRNYLLRRLPDEIYITYDADALRVTGSPSAPAPSTAPAAAPLSSSPPAREGLAPSLQRASSHQLSPSHPLTPSPARLSSRRNQHFANSAQHFATQLFDLFSTVNHDCKICFVMGKPDADQKGIDDLIEVHGHQAVATDLRKFQLAPTLQESRFFTGFTLAKSSYRRKLSTLFLKKQYREWAEHHTGADFNRLAAGFTYRGARYRAISSGDLIDETITYELITDPFHVELPTINLTINRYLREQYHPLAAIFAANDTVALESPTGSGKTTFLIKYARRNRQPLVIAMPTINLAKQVARQHKGFALTGDYDYGRVQTANEVDLIVCTYDTLHQVPHLFLRLLVIDEAHNFVNQYGQVYRGYKPFRAETLRKVAALLPRAKKTILLSGTMPALLCQTLGATLVTVTRTENPNVRVFDVEADGSTNEALARSLITSLAEVFTARAPRAANSGSSKSEASNSSAAASKSGNAASKQFASGKLQVVFWNNTDQLSAVKSLIVQLGFLREDQIATISRSHVRAGLAPALNDIISQQKIKPGIKLLLCTCLISEGVNIKNRNVGRIFTVGLRDDDTFRQFIARFRKLKVVNVFSILPTERDLLPDFFSYADEELLDNLEIAELQARQLERSKARWENEHAIEDLPFLSDIERTKDYAYRNHLLNLTYRDDVWAADPLHVLAAIHGRKVATANNCYFYTRLRAAGFTVLRIRKLATVDLVDDAVTEAGQSLKEDRKAFFNALLEDLLQNPLPVVNALLLWYAEQNNRHGRASLQRLVPDLLDGVNGATGAGYLSQHRRRFSEKTRARILCYCRLHALGVADKEAFLRLSPTEFNRQFRAARFYFELQLYDDPAGRKQMKAEHKEEVRIKKHIARHLTPDPDVANRNPAASHPPRAPDEDSGTDDALINPSASIKVNTKLTGRAIVDRLKPLFLVQRTHPPFHRKPLPRSAKNLTKNGLVDLLNLTPARAINLVRDIVHCTVEGSGRYRTVTVHAAFTSENPPPLAVCSTKLIADPARILPLLAA